jgi:hypothetical protein
MARGVGTAIGVALTSLVFASGRGITSVALLLLAIAVLAGAISIVWSKAPGRVASAV